MRTLRQHSILFRSTSLRAPNQEGADFAAQLCLDNWLVDSMNFLFNFEKVRNSCSNFVPLIISLLAACSQAGTHASHVATGQVLKPRLTCWLRSCSWIIRRTPVDIEDVLLRHSPQRLRLLVHWTAHLERRADLHPFGGSSITIVTLTWEQIAEMSEAGISFASHAMSHQILCRLSDADCSRG
jgi:hypothetical protein